jgi:hypothetical protein
MDILSEDHSLEVRILLVFFVRRWPAPGVAFESNSHECLQAQSAFGRILMAGSLEDRSAQAVGHEEYQVGWEFGIAKQEDQAIAHHHFVYQALGDRMQVQ